MGYNTFDLPFGVPQGSCLGPVLFTQYVSSLFSIFSNHSVSAHAYADDHQLYMAFSPNLESQKQAVSCMESCLDDVKSWMISNKPKMNDSKTEFIIISSHQQLAKIDLTSIRVGESRISAVDDVQNLRAYLDKNMSMKTHIEVKCITSFCQLYSLRRIRKYLSCQATVYWMVYLNIKFTNYKGSKTWQLDWFINSPNLVMLHHYSWIFIGSLMSIVSSISFFCLHIKAFIKWPLSTLMKC